MLNTNTTTLTAEEMYTSCTQLQHFQYIISLTYIFKRKQTIENMNLLLILLNINISLYVR